MNSTSTHLPVPEGLGSVWDAPNLPAGFTDTFTSRYIKTGNLRQHAVIGGEGPPLLLVHGWPENWYSWRLLASMATAARSQGMPWLGGRPGGWPLSHSTPPSCAASREFVQSTLFELKLNKRMEIK